MNKITFHKANPEDAHMLAEYRIRFAIELAGGQTSERIEALKKQMIEYFTRATLENSCISFIAKSNNTIAGLGSVHVREVPGNFKNMSGKWGYIMNMYTVPEFRKQGICSEILKLLVNEGKRHGITAFELHATEEGKPVYLKGGFQIHNEPTLRKYFDA